MKSSLWLMLMLLSFHAGAQVSMTAQVPPAGVILKAQLWNILLVSASNNPVNVRITLRLLDAQTNQPVLAGVTRNIVLTRGAKQLQVEDVMPVQYEYLSAAVDRSVNGLLFAGSYIACYSLMVEGDKTGSQQREDCIPFAIEPVSPPLLNRPEHQSTLETKLPQFSWLPPAPLNIFNDLNYEMILTEVHAGQSAEESVQQNIPILRVPHLKEMYVNYPSGGVGLDTSKNYAWSVIVRNGLSFAAQTEVWTFRIKGLEQKKNNYTSAYVQLRKELDGTVINGSKLLQIGYTNETGDSTVKYEMIALEEGNKVVHTGILNVKRGNNRLDVRLQKGFSNGKSYLFRLRNTRNEYWQIKFIYTKED